MFADTLDQLRDTPLASTMLPLALATFALLGVGLASSDAAAESEAHYDVSEPDTEDVSKPDTGTTDVEESDIHDEVDVVEDTENTSDIVEDTTEEEDAENSVDTGNEDALDTREPMGDSSGRQGGSDADQESDNGDDGGCSTTAAAPSTGFLAALILLAVARTRPLRYGR